jgi:hypothetical protein
LKKSSAALSATCHQGAGRRTELKNLCEFWMWTQIWIDLFSFLYIHIKYLIFNLKLKKFPYRVRI